MSYRDDLAAAQSRADAALHSLAAEREARENDAAHVAKLERSLARSLEELAELREHTDSQLVKKQATSLLRKSSFANRSLPQTPPPSDSSSFFVNLLVLAVSFLGLVAFTMFWAYLSVMASD